MTAADTTAPSSAASTATAATTSTENESSEGIAGRTNYRKWDKITRDLVTETEEEEERESALESEKLGHTRVPYSKAEEEERVKAEAARKAKQALDAQKDREQAATAILEDILEEEEECVISPDMLGGKRVVLLRNITGPGKIVLPPVLSQLGHTAEQDNVCVRGLIKVFIENCTDVEIVSLCKIITSTIEVTRCENVQLGIGQEKISTIQADMCSDLTIKFQSAGIWGGKEDRIYHAGVSDMTVILPNHDKLKDEPIRKSMDYIKDGAQERGNATKEEYQFVTFVEQATNQLKTESLVRIKGRMLTETERRETGEIEPSQENKGMDAEELKDVINQCVTHKGEGNDAFKQGEYAQAVLFYSLAIDKSEALPSYSTADDSNSNKNKTTFTERHICYSNRAACFLKLGHHDKALNDADACLNLHPDFIKALFRKGLALHAMKRYEEARPVLAKCLTKEPKNKQIQQALQFCEIHLEKERRKRMMG
uniref:C-CAP/cofactor C-like domain-containing protein n=1 Tax=Helicotheca tamesis TaxID=374047 RepID=A0A7S2MG98_9STRA|eukprot:CAMPEP_0185733596 /NCGR_PEP_ID=MMETSP1171-20130828/20075_1 /TAXON_ID=374046 /ORGANISM="Helicotheca tamensis, Strain CCMP826" /LENGTH=483 /DNA_ID=CAMNT_0028403373 /DNA_START=30 /DNA_END=1481 /DNA_ORIENTATION=+